MTKTPGQYMATEAAEAPKAITTAMLDSKPVATVIPSGIKILAAAVLLTKVLCKMAPLTLLCRPPPSLVALFSLKIVFTSDSAPPA